MSEVRTKWPAFLGTIPRDLWPVCTKFLCQLLCLQLLSVGLFPWLRTKHYSGRTKGKLIGFDTNEFQTFLRSASTKKGDEKNTLQVLCSQSTGAVISLLSPKIIVSIGRYTEDRIKSLYKSGGIRPDIVHKCMPHPSPRSLNNTNWNDKAKVWLRENDVMKYLQPPAPMV